jgi:hypothetical protein
VVTTPAGARSALSVVPGVGLIAVEADAKRSHRCWIEHF